MTLRIATLTLCHELEFLFILFFPQPHLLLYKNIRSYIYKSVPVLESLTEPIANPGKQPAFIVVHWQDFSFQG